MHHRLDLRQMTLSNVLIPVKSSRGFPNENKKEGLELALDEAAASTAAT